MKQQMYATCLLNPYWGSYGLGYRLWLQHERHNLHDMHWNFGKACDYAKHNST